MISVAILLYSKFVFDQRSRGKQVRVQNKFTIEKLKSSMKGGATEDLDLVMWTDYLYDFNKLSASYS